MAPITVTRIAVLRSSLLRYPRAMDINTMADRLMMTDWLHWRTLFNVGRGESHGQDMVDNHPQHEKCTHQGSQ